MTLTLVLNRYTRNNDEVSGVMSIANFPICHTLEDEHRVVKVPGETCIPAGEYDVILRPVNEGNVNKKYLKDFPTMHQGMLWLQDVPGFTYIYIHIGNRDEHTAGCILVGQQNYIDDQGHMELYRSTQAYVQLYKMVVSAAKTGNLKIKVIDNDEV